MNLFQKWQHYLLSYVVGVMMMTAPFYSYADFSNQTNTKLYNGFSGLKFLAQTGSLKAKHLDTFIQAQNNELKEKGLLEPLKQLREKLNKVDSCQEIKKEGMSDDLARILFSDIQLCDENNALNFDDILNLQQKVTLIVEDMEKSQDKFTKEQYADLAKEIYQRQRAMYVGSSFLAYKKYFNPQMSLESFMKEWTLEKGAGLRAEDEFYKKDLEQYGKLISQNFSDPKANIKELAVTSEKKLKLVGTQYEQLMKAINVQKSYESMLLNSSLLIEPQDNTSTDIKVMREEVLSDFPLQQGFHSLGGKSQDRFLLDIRVDEIEKANREREQARLKTLAQIENSDELAYYVSLIEKASGKKVIVYDDQLNSPDKKVVVNVKGKAQSPLNRFEQDFSTDLADIYEGETLRLIQQDFLNKNPDEVMAVSLSQIWSLQKNVMERERVSGPMRDQLMTLRSRSAYQEDKHEEVRDQVMASDTWMIVNGSQDKKLVDDWLAPPQLELSGDTRAIYSDTGLRQNESLQNAEVQTMLRNHLKASAELMRELDNLYDENSSDPKEFIKQSLFYNPALASKVIAAKPEYAGMLCMLAKQKVQDNVDQAKRDRIFALVTMVAALALVVGTLGTGAVALFGVGGAIAANTAMAASAIGFGLGVAGAGYYGVRSHQLQEEFELADSMFRATGQIKDATGIDGEKKVRDLYEKSKENFNIAVISGLLAPVDGLVFLAALKQVKTSLQLEKLASSEDEIVHFINEAKASSLADPATPLQLEQRALASDPIPSAVLKDDELLGTKIEMPEGMWDKHYAAIRSTMKDENPATVNRSEWKGKFSDEEAFDLLQKNYKSSTGEDFPKPTDGNYKKAVDELAAKIRANGNKYPLQLRDPPPPEGSADTTFTYYTKTLVDSSGAKHQFRVRTYVRTIEPSEMKVGVSIEAYNSKGKFIFNKLSDGSYEVSLNDKPYGVFKTEKEFKEAFDNNLQFYAPHGKKFKLEVKSRPKDSVDIEDYKELSGDIYVQKLSVDLSEKEVFDIFNSTKPLEEIKATIKANPKNNPERIDAIFDLFNDAQKLDPEFRTLSGSTEYKRYAFSIAVPDKIGDSAIPLQTTMDYDMGVRSVYATDGSLLNPMNAMRDSSNLRTPLDSVNESFHIELKAPRDLVERIATDKESVSNETMEALKNYTEGNNITNKGKFHHMDQQKPANQ